MNKREFLKKSSLGTLGLMLVPALAEAALKGKTIRTAHIGLGVMGKEDLKAIASHKSVEVVALCDVDSNLLAQAKALYPNAKTYSDYRTMLSEMEKQIDAVVVSTPDHTHAPASMLAMELDKAVYCQKPLTHYVSESRAMNKLAADKKLVTQMGIQVHSFYDYKLATLLIQSGIIGKVHTVRAWSPKNWGYDGNAPEGQDPVPANLDWNLWLGTSKDRPYKEGVYHPGNWRKLVDYGCGTLGDMGVHIFDTPYNALQLDVPRTITTQCRPSNGFSFPENNTVTYDFPGTKYTTDSLKWVWYDGPGAPEDHQDLVLPLVETTPEQTAVKQDSAQSVEDKTSLDVVEAENGTLPEQGAMFIGEKGRLLLPHFMQLPQKIVDGEYVDISKEIKKISRKHNLGAPIRNYNSEGPKHYHQFIDACLGKDECTAPFSYSARLTETILLGTIAGRFPGETLNWDAENARFKEDKANKYLSGEYRDF
ncbi:oxidoreductase domain-containing protein [Galbibacter marinus]|uniref:Oxidoreductase domain-containing protein n=1 Tax=Galbibacter marinus TaxID=555500 RepID=K2PUG9_9FLAO|nr:Gfo/Idh/MocA family oxidoreductase [Galbibacter marinus]EKF56275.1 oxidoreductase domain-containing protein [Galbibacter marinus]